LQGIAVVHRGRQTVNFHKFALLVDSWNIIKYSYLQKDLIKPDYIRLKNRGENVGKSYICIIIHNVYKMATISFIVRSDRKKQPATIYLRFRDGRKTDIIVQTPERIFPEYWSNKTQSFRQRILYTEIFTEENKVGIEEKFSRMRDFILNELFNLKGNAVTKEWLKTIIDKFYDKRNAGTENLSQYIERYHSEATNGERLTYYDKKIYSYGYLKNIKGFQNLFNEYQGIYPEKRLNELKEKNETPRPYKPVSFENITIDFYNDFVSFCKQRNHSPNTIGKYVKILKGLMKQAKEEGLHNQTEFERKSFKIIGEMVHNIYLNESEIKKIFELDLKDSPLYESARDIFLVGCYTAQRFSDYSKISPSNLKVLNNGKKVIELIQQKTGEKVIIPVRSELEEILKRYDYNLPKCYEQKVNDRIKKIAVMAGISDLIKMEYTRGGLKVKKEIPKNELVVTHTARRSGCTNMYLAGIPTIDIMKISGHKTEKEFLKYINVSKEETAINLSDHPYFNRAGLKVI